MWAWLITKQRKHSAGMNTPLQAIELLKNVQFPGISEDVSMH